MMLKVVLGHRHIEFKSWGYVYTSSGSEIYHLLVKVIKKMSKDF